MSVHYRGKQNSVKKDGYAQILREAAEYFAGQRIQMLGNGFDEILSEQQLFQTYTERLCRDLTADEAVQMAQLFENARMQIMSESTISGVQPIAALSMPTIRKMWVKVALRNALPTEVVKQPKFSISYMEPYLFDKAGNRVSIPKALRDMSNNEMTLKKLSTADIAVPVSTFDLFAPVGASKAAGDSVDPIFNIVTVKMTVKDAGGLNAEAKVSNVRFGLELRDTIYGEVSAVHSTGKVTTDVIFGKLDRTNGTLTLASVNGTITAVVIDGRLTAENNTNQQSVSFDIKTKDVTIGTGAHLNAPLPIEWLQDTMAMYQIDGALEVVDLMSNIHAQKLEQEILNYVDTSYSRNGLTYGEHFDVHPPARYAGSPKDWREELKIVIDHVAIKMKNDSSFTGGKFVLIGNPLDVNILTNVSWVFNHTTDERGGVEVDFNLGAYSGANLYEIVSSPNVGQGKLRMIYIPGTPKQMTYKYYPYTFNVEKGYIDPNRPFVPSIMMTKRHTIEEMTPLAAEIVIDNNDGKAV